MIRFKTVGAGLSRDCVEAFDSIRGIKVIFIVALLLISPLSLSYADNTKASLALGDRTGTSNTSISVPIQIASSGNLVGIQFDVLFNSADIDITGVTPATLATDHTFLDDEFIGGRHRFLIYSPTNQAFDNGIIADLELDLSDSFSNDKAQLNFSNVSFVTADGTILTVEVAPFVQLTNPTSNLAANELDDLDLSAIAISTTGDIARIEFQVDGRTVAVDSEGPFSATWTVDAPGNVLLTAVAIDSEGRRGTSPGIGVEVTASPFLNAWRQANFNAEQRTNPAISGIFADPEGDGIYNFLELGFGLNPLTEDFDKAPRLEIVDENSQEFLAIRYQRPESMTDVVYTVEVSDNMEDWKGTDQDVVETILETREGIETIRARSVAPLDGSSIFIRIRIDPSS